MAAASIKTKSRPLSKGQRRHVRKLKQESRQAGTAYRPPFSIARPSGTPRKDDTQK